MPKSNSHIIYLAGILLVLSGFLFAFSKTPENIDSVSSSVLADVTCAIPNSAITVVNQDPYRLEILFNSQPLTSISRVDFIFVNDTSSGSEKVIGKGVRDTATQSKWRMIWDTRYFEQLSTSIAGRVRATVYFSNNTQCNTPISPIFSIPSNSNQFAPEIEAIINPPQWSSLVNTSTNVNVDFLNLPQELHQYVIVKWQPQIGFISSPNNRSTTYFSGSSAGNGKLKVSLVYSGKFIQREADITVYSSTESNNQNSGSSGSDDSTTTVNNDDSGSNDNKNEINNSTDDSKEEPLPEISEDANLEEIISVLKPRTTEPSTITAPSRAIALILESDQEVKSCIVEKASDTTISTILRENRRPRSDEFNKIVGCFEQQKNVIPSILAPVAPEDVKSETIKESEAIKIKGLRNANKVSDEDKDKTTLVIEGSATPNSNILLYVFSEPLVLATSADDNGEWSYTLEDPLESGEHEVYALVDRGDGVYEKSTVTSFFIGTAEAGEENPNGLSLELITEPTVTASNRSANIYIAATIGIVVFAGVIFASYMLMRLRTSGAGSFQISSPPTNTDTEDSQYKNFVDGK